MSGAATSKDSAAFCADLVRTHDFVRYASTLFLPQAQRRALLSVYAFNVETTRTGTAVSTYNILLAEGRRVAAALIAVE